MHLRGILKNEDWKKNSISNNFMPILQSSMCNECITKHTKVWYVTCIVISFDIIWSFVVLSKIKVNTIIFKFSTRVVHKWSNPMNYNRSLVPRLVKH